MHSSVWRFFYLVSLCCSAAEACVKLNNRYLENRILRIIYHSSLHHCSAECDADALCLSFSFFKPTLECHLNLESSTGKDSNLVEKKNWYFADKGKLPSASSESCKSLQCLDCEICHLTRQRNQAKCVSRDSYVTTPQSLKEDDIKHNCHDVMTQNRSDGVYVLNAAEACNLPVFCDMTTDEGGWLVIQRRQDGSVDFFRTWQEYEVGFGDLNGEFWLGNKYIHKITNYQTYELRVDLEDFEGNKTYASYSYFSIEDKNNGYRLHIGSYSGSAGDSLGYHNGSCFSTKDVEFGKFPTNCATIFQGAWWYLSCHRSNLNGLYLGGQTDRYAVGVVWSYWRGHFYSLKRSEMKIRPTRN